MKIGVTGTRSGMNDYQIGQVRHFLHSIIGEHPSSELHHGDCVGVDVEVAILARTLGFRIVCHPPINDDLRAYHDSEETRNRYTYFERNRNIVNETDCLLVVPYQETHQKTGGTWYTHDYGLKKKKPTIIVFPSSIKEIF